MAGVCRHGVLGFVCRILILGGVSSRVRGGRGVPSSSS